MSGPSVNHRWASGILMPKKLCRTKARCHDASEPKVLHLSLKGKPFEVMIIGEKRSEFRGYTAYWRKRLLHPDETPKTWDYIEFTNGYGSARPKFRTPHIGTDIWHEFRHTYSNGFSVDLQNNKTIVLHLGRVFWRSERYGDRPVGSRGNEASARRR